MGILQSPNRTTLYNNKKKREDSEEFDPQPDRVPEKGAGEMTEREFKILCNAVRGGEDRFVENRDSHYSGKIVACGADRFEVEISGRRESWPMGSCVETMGSRYGHKERSLDAHPWDTDRFNPYI